MNQISLEENRRTRRQARFIDAKTMLNNGVTANISTVVFKMDINK